MRFLALLKKEFHECLPWLLLAVIVLFGFGFFAFWADAPYTLSNRYQQNISPGSYVESYYLTKLSSLTDEGALLLMTSIGLGLLLAGRQFWVPNFTKIWGFMLHRSVSRLTLLCAMLTAVAISFIVSLGLAWTALYWYACHSKSYIPPAERVFVEGWIYIAGGFIAYLGTALAGLSRAKWWTTKILGLCISVCILVTVFSQWRLDWAAAALIIGAVILLCQIVDVFLNREF